MSSFTTPLVVEVTTLKKRGRTLYKIEKSFLYRVGSYHDPVEVIEVPCGFLTDFQSFPRIFRLVYDNAHRAKAAVVHDYLLCIGRTPKEADAIFKEALGVLGAGKLEQFIFWCAVRMSSMTKQLLGIPVY